MQSLDERIAVETEKMEQAKQRQVEAEAELEKLDEEDRTLEESMERGRSEIAEALQLAAVARALAAEWDALAMRAGAHEN